MFSAVHFKTCQGCNCRVQWEDFITFHIIGRIFAGTKTHTYIHNRRSVVESQPHLCFYIDTYTLLFLPNRLRRIIFADLSLPLSLSLTYTRDVLVSSIPEAAGYAERKCDPAHKKWMKALSLETLLASLSQPKQTFFLLLHHSCFPHLCFLCAFRVLSSTILKHFQHFIDHIIQVPKMCA